MHRKSCIAVKDPVPWMGLGGVRGERKVPKSQDHPPWGRQILHFTPCRGVTKDATEKQRRGEKQIGTSAAFWGPAWRKCKATEERGLGLDWGTGVGADVNSKKKSKERCERTAPTEGYLSLDGRSGKKTSWKAC